MWTENGILAGDPQAPLAAKIYLQRALKAFCRKFPFLHADLWIDDLSFDVVDRDVENAVRIAIQAYNYIKELLEEDNLKLSVKKTGFIASNVQAKRLLRQLPSNGPKVHDVMKDLGVDCTAGRLRRIQTLKSRRSKAAKKTKKLHALKIPHRRLRDSKCTRAASKRALVGTSGNGLGTTNQATHPLHNGAADGNAAHRQH